MQIDAHNRLSRSLPGLRPRCLFGLVRSAAACVRFAAAFLILTMQGLPLLGQADSEASALVTRVDELIDARLSEMGWKPAGPCSDEAFVRRVYLDLTGLPPTAAEVVDFTQDESTNKDAALVDKLLSTPSSAAHFAASWSQWMLPDNDANPFLPVNNGLQNWLRARFAENLRYDRMVADLLVSSGPVQTGPTQFFVALEGKPEKIAAKTARVFMGVQLDCAECHDHPFDDWTQQDFWGLAAYFAQLSVGNNPVGMARGEVADVDDGEVVLPDTEEIVSPKPLVASGYSGVQRGTRRQQLTLWLTTPDNPFLARATVNRVWSLLFGRGLIEPIDDMRSLEMASHPALLSELSDAFTESGYDLRELIATLAKTRAYRRATTHVSGNPPEASYATMSHKPLTARQLANSLQQVGRQVAGEDGQNPMLALTNQVGRLRGDASEAELGIVSALVMLHGEVFDNVSREQTSRLLKALEAPYMDRQKQLRWMFLSTLNRSPTQHEQAAFSTLFKQLDGAQNDDSNGGDATWQSDLLWALLNSTEFAMTP